MSASPGVVAAPMPGAVTTNSPMLQHTVLAPSAAPASGPHVVSVLSVVVAVAALGAIAAFAVVLFLYLRPPQEGPPPAAQAPTSAPEPAVGPALPRAKPVPNHAAPLLTVADAGPPAPAPPAPSGGTVDVSVASVTKFYDHAELLALARKHHGELVSCYGKTLARDPRFSGTAQIVVSNTLGPQSCSWNGADGTLATTLCDCFKGAMSSWAWPRATIGAALLWYDVRVTP
jgi:hypothetical protein